MSVSLTPELDRYVLSKVETGRYNSASEVLREALRLMQEKDEIRQIQLTEEPNQCRKNLDFLSLPAETLMRFGMTSLSAREVPDLIENLAEDPE